MPLVPPQLPASAGVGVRRAPAVHVPAHAPVADGVHLAAEPVRSSERGLVQRSRLLELLLKVGGVVLVAHPEVREVVEEEAEDGLAVLLVLEGVQDVRVPELVELPRGDDDHARVEGVQQQEAAIHHLELFDRLLVHAFRLELRHDRLEVQTVDEGLVLFGGLAHDDSLWLVLLGVDQDK